MLTPAQLVWLLASVARGDQAAFEALYEATSAKLFGIVLRIVRDQALAEKILQDAYLKIWNDAAQYNPDEVSPLAWMVAIVRNRAIDTVRKRAEPLPEDAADVEAASDTLARREMTDELKALLECVGQLEPDRQKLVLLAYYNGWNRDELAARFGAELGEVKTWLRDSLLDVRTCLGLA
jgi:RNA polymerase sigma-70 factor (ECF subfamily)